MAPSPDPNQTTIGDFLVRRLVEAGVKDLFGVPGDFSLGFLNCVSLNPDLNYVGTCNELNAAYAADGYARLHGIGALTTTYAVGELSAINGVAGSWAEQVPVVKITGCPSSRDFKNQPLLHHTLGDYQIPYKMYENITVSTLLINSPDKVVEKVDHVLQNCLFYKKPVYIGICCDMVSELIEAPQKPFQLKSLEESDSDALNECITETINFLKASEKTVIFPGILLRRLNLQEQFKQIVEKTNLPYVSMMLSKTILDETHPNHLGLYCGNRSRAYVQEFVDSAACHLILGEFLTDFNTGGFSFKYDNRKTIYAARSYVQIGYHTYNQVFIEDYLKGLLNAVAFFQLDQAIRIPIRPASKCCVHIPKPFTPVVNQPLTMARLFDRLSNFLPERSILIAETGASLFNAAEVLMPAKTNFIGQTFYGSIGYSVGACLGACVAEPTRPTVLIVGDGSFQVTAQEISTMMRVGTKPVVIVVNNDGYTIERVICDAPYNDIQMWKYSELPKVLGDNSQTFRCETEDALESALSQCTFEKFTMIEVVIRKWDCNSILVEAGKGMRSKNKLGTASIYDQCVAEA